MSEVLKVFILGSPRSGTSITYYAMREVVRLRGRGESHVFPIFQRMIHQFYIYIQDLKKSPGVLAGDLDTKTFRDVLHTYISRFYQDKYEGQSFVDKTPGAESIRGCELILGVFPDAKIVLLQRNGIEVVNSYQNKFGATFESACQSWKQVVAASAQLLNTELGSMVLVVDQYDLTNSPQESAARIAAHIGKHDITPALAAFFTERRVEKSSTHDWKHRLTLADVNWTSEERNVFTDICGESMLALGYAL